MAKKQSIHHRADRAYDYLLAHKGQILKYIIIALATGLWEFLAERFLAIPAMAAFFLRLLLLFIALKIFAYPQSGKAGFAIATQAMIAIMLTLLSAAIINYLILSLASLTGRPTLMAYLGGAILEILYFIIFQFAVFRQEKS